ncbi:MAG TPA: metallophosphoesterase [Pyrinomonadaceae bacterium]|nr:metallophosphoesterase [Pyrinomonadaceae bacterium]
MRIFASSDLHTDFPENWRLVRELSAQAFLDDTLIVAGDIADDLGIIEGTLKMLSARFRHVCYLPGNHELWVRGEAADSVEKFRQVLGLCRRLGVHTQPVQAGGCWVVPLFSWYDADAARAAVADYAELEGWSDFYFCKWPRSMGLPVADFFLRLNEPHLRSYDRPVITFSHFAPRADLLPAPGVLRFKALFKVACCDGLDAQLRRAGALVHVFGHSHIACDTVVDDVRYVQNPLRYPRERRAPEFPLKMIWRS